MMKISIPRHLLFSLLFLFFAISIQPVKEVMISFDTEINVGDENATLEILDILNKYETKATFFLMGEFVLKNPNITRRILIEGHEIACHTQTHKSLWNLNEDKIKEEIIFCKESIQNITNTSPLGFRAPWRLITRKASKVLVEQNFLYDASLFKPIPNFYNIKEVKTSSWNGLPLDDYILLNFFKFEPETYFQLSKYKYDKKISLSYHPHIIIVYKQEFENLIKYYNQKGAKFITHHDSLI